MSKAMLLLDEMPKGCLLCRFSGIGVDGILVCDVDDMIDRLHAEGEGTSGRSDWCPLKVLPERAPENHLSKDDLDREFYDSHFAFDCGHAQGWNDCLDAISGKEDTDGQTEDM